MNYADIKKVDVANGDGVRVSVFVSGCHHHCKGCFNECAWDFNYGNEFNQEAKEKVTNITFLTKAEDKNLSVACSSIISRYLIKKLKKK